VDKGWRNLTFYGNFIPDLEPVSGNVIMIKEVKKRIGKPEVYENFPLFKILILNILFAILNKFQAKIKFIFGSYQAYSQKN